MDENMPPHLAKGFQVLQAPEGLRNNRPIEVRYIPTTFYHGVPDEEWIPLVGKENACVLTRDININRRKHELELYRRHNLGLFFLRGASKKQGMSVWEMVRSLAKHWENISRSGYEEERPFAYQVTLGGS